MKTKTLPAIPSLMPRAMRRTATLTGVAPCANAPAVRETRRGYHTVRMNARTREAIRVDVVTSRVTVLHPRGVTIASPAAGLLAVPGRHGGCKR